MSHTTRILTHKHDNFVSFLTDLQYKAIRWIDIFVLEIVSSYSKMTYQYRYLKSAITNEMKQQHMSVFRI